MTMEDREERLNSFLTLWNKEVLKDNGKISAELAKAHALSEFEKYRVIKIAEKPMVLTMGCKALCYNNY